MSPKYAPKVVPLHTDVWTHIGYTYNILKVGKNDIEKVYQHGLISIICLGFILKYLAILEIGFQYLDLCDNYNAIIISIATRYHVVLHQTIFLGQLFILFILF